MHFALRAVPRASYIHICSSAHLALCMCPVCRAHFTRVWPARGVGWSLWHNKCTWRHIWQSPGPQHPRCCCVWPPFLLLEGRRSFSSCRNNHGQTLDNLQKFLIEEPAFLYFGKLDFHPGLATSNRGQVCATFRSVGRHLLCLTMSGQLFT